MSYYIIPKGRSSYLRFVNEDFVIYGAGRELVDGKFAIYRVGGTFRRRRFVIDGAARKVVDGKFAIYGVGWAFRRRRFRHLLS